MIYLYNPTTDLALAAGGRTYTPKHSVELFERKNMLLPCLYASSGDSILLLYDVLEEELIANPLYRQDLHYIKLSDLSLKNERIFPWGWNLALRQLLLKNGYPEKLMPNEETLACWRQLAHRSTAVRLNELLSNSFVAKEFKSIENALEYVDKEKEVMIKLPWSSSGRGILAIREGDLKSAKRRIVDGINNQGSVIIEKLWHKILDFATEWESDGNNITFLGYSIFETDHAGRYIKNVIASQSELINILKTRVTIDELNKLVEEMHCHLKYLLIDKATHPYVGPFGVDGLITVDNNIVPCIEINLRMTMGHVALKKIFI